MKSARADFIKGEHPLTIEKRKERSLAGYLGIALRGMCMGAADVVPGVSGGTMALILGIYQELIEAIRSMDARFIRTLLAFRFREAMSLVPWKFLGFLVLGILFAVFSLARLLAWLLENKPVLLWSFFFGLILASILSVGREIERWKVGTLTWAVVGTVGAYLLVGMVPLNTPEAPWFLFLSGAVAICAMILPGISGSFILVLFGKYHFVLAAVNEKNFFVLAVVTAGALFGITSFSRLLSWLLKKHHDGTIALLLGLMLGSLRKIWPWKKTLETAMDLHGNTIPLIQINVLPSEWNSEVGIALSLALAGFMMVLSLQLWAARPKVPEAP
jgi:putative membrane protein